jgi:hypothetical protein
VAGTLDERRWRIVRSEVAKKRVVRMYTKYGARLPLKLAADATGASFSRHRPRSLMPPLSSSSSSSDEAKSRSVIGPDDFVKDPAEEERALAEALAQTATEPAAQQTAKVAERLAALRVIEAL